MPSMDFVIVGSRFEFVHNYTWAVYALCSMFLVYNLARCTYRVWFHPLSKFPGPPLLSAVYFPFLYEHFINGTWIRKVAKLHRQYGPIIRIGPDHLAIDGAIGWPEVFSPRSAQLNEYPKLAKLFQGDSISLLCAPRDIHRRQRHQIRPAFSDAAIIQQEATVRKYVDMLLSQLEEQANQQQIVNIVEWLHFTAFDIVGDLTISESFQSLQNSSYHPWVQSFFQAIRAISIRRFLRSYSILNMLGTLISHASLTKTDEVLSYMATKVKARITLQYGGSDTTSDYVAYMLAKTKSGESGMSEGEILATSPFLVIAGSETIATALSGFWFYLARDQRVYDAITAEIRSAFSTEAEITMQSTVQLNYLVACIKEILRIYPPIPSMPQRVSPGGNINGKYVPAGTRISVYQWATFRNPEHFAEPVSFIPERWLPLTDFRFDERFKQDNHAVFKPFGHGPRDCIGKTLALAEMRLIIARFLFRFNYTLAEGQERWHDGQRAFTVWDKGPLYLHLEARK